jgi:hypothetical protein
MLPHLLAYSLFVATVVAFFSPIFFEGKKLFQGDIPHHEGIRKQIVEDRKKTGKEPLWAQAVFSGMPAYLIDVSYHEPLHIGMRWIIEGGLPQPIGYILAALLASYILLLSLGVRPGIAVAGALAYGLSTFTLVSAAIGHDGKVAAMAYMPLVLAGVHIAYNRNRWVGSLLTALGLSLEISATHPQITYYLGVLLVLYGLNQLLASLASKALRQFCYTTGLLVLAAVLAAGANVGRLWTIYEYSQSSTRGSAAWSSEKAATQGLDKSYAFMWSLGKAETMTLLVPSFYGGSSHQQLPFTSAVGQALQQQRLGRQQVRAFLQQAPTYWGEQPFTEGPLYLGIVVCFLYLASLGVVGPQHRYWLIAGTALAILWAWGKNFAGFNDWMYEHLPGYHKFRAVTTAVVIAQVTTGVGACLFLQYFLVHGFTRRVRKAFLLTGGSLAALLIVLRLVAEGMHYVSPQDVNFPRWLALALQADRKQMLVDDIFRSLLLLGLASLLIVLYAKQRNRKKLYELIFCGALAVLIGIDFYTVGKRYVGEKSYQKQAHIDALEATPAKQMILQDSTLGYRVLHPAHPFTDGRTSYYYRSVGGYHAAKMRRYQDLVEYGLAHECHQVRLALAASEQALGPFPLLNMLNTRYYIHPTNGSAVANPHALGPAWFVRELAFVEGPTAVLEKLQQADLQHVAVIDRTDWTGLNLGQTAGEGVIILQVYEPSYLQYRAQAIKGGLAVFSEIYYQPGWQAWVDDKPTDLLRANYVLRALWIPEGEHTITFKFQPLSYRIGNSMMLAFHGLLIALLAFALGYSFYKKNLARLSS